ncbi:MAG: hypothetical protein ACLFMO_06195 [Eubacteriales bacterium]
MRKQPKWLNLIFLLGIGVSFYALIATYIDRSNLPSNVCPIEDRNGILYLGISILVIYLLTSIIYEIYIKHKNNK